MYQTIDDPQDELEAAGVNPARFWFWLISAMAMGAIFIAVAVIKPVESPDASSTPANQEARSLYITAVSEVSAPMRRARLQDFLQTHPDTPRKAAVQAQLDVINWHDSQAWNDVTLQAYSAGLSKDEKLALLSAYEADWGGSVFGTRGGETDALRTELMGLSEAAPSRTVQGRVSAIPKSIPDKTLLGEARRVVTYTPPPAIAPKVVPGPTGSNAVIVPPRIRRDRRPKYPRSALRKNIDALVVLRLNIDEDGKVGLTELVSVEASRYEKDFVRAAEKAARRSRYYPKTVNGEPVGTMGVIKRYRFQSQG